MAEAPRTSGEEPGRGQAGVEERIPVGAARQVLQEVAADELLRERRAPLRQEQPQPVAALPPFTERAHRRLLDHPRQRTVVHAGMGEEALVLGGQDGLAQDERHLVVGHDPAVLARQFDQDRAVRVADDAGRGGLEPDERLEVGQAGAVEVDVVDQPRARKQDRRGDCERDREEHASAPCRGPQLRGQPPRRAQLPHEEQVSGRPREGTFVALPRMVHVHGETPLASASTIGMSPSVTLRARDRSVCAVVHTREGERRTRSWPETVRRNEGPRDGAHAGRHLYTSEQTRPVLAGTLVRQTASVWRLNGADGEKECVRCRQSG